MHSSNLSPEAKGGVRVCWAAGEYKAAAGAIAKAKMGGSAAASPTTADCAVGEAVKKAGVAMPLAPRAGASGKEKSTCSTGREPEPRGGAGAGYPESRVHKGYYELELCRRQGQKSRRWQEAAAPHQQQRAE